MELLHEKRKRILRAAHIKLPLAQQYKSRDVAISKLWPIPIPPITKITDTNTYSNFANKICQIKKFIFFIQ